MLATYTLTRNQFERIVSLAQARWGLSIAPNKLQLVTSRLSSFLRKSSFADVGEYLQHVEQSASEQDLLEFFDLLSTNVTSFFRDRAHFDYLSRELLSAPAQGAKPVRERRLRLWSAGCSIGCEPYTMAMLAHDTLVDMRGADVQILATDLSNYAVAEARAGCYDEETLKDLPRELQQRHFTASDGGWTIRPHLRALVKVGQLNLMGHWPMRGPFDAIFCRNVMIYFDAPTRERLVQRFAALLRPGGMFAVGSAETLAGMNVDLRNVQPSVYVK
jgi:chemotaxis protein methyltransferase CheR